MSTRVILNGRVAWANERPRPSASRALNVTRVGGKLQKVNCAEGIDPLSPAAPFTAGIPFACPSDKLTYRVVARLNASEGWATTQFWQTRWRISHLGVLELARTGLLDAVIEQGSQVRRYRCRDEARVLQSEPVQRAARLRRSQYANAAKTAKGGKIPKRKPWV